MSRKVEVSFHEKIDNLRVLCYNTLCIGITIWYYSGGHGNSNIACKVLPTIIAI